ncbi:MAG TPA: hypothetical protein VEC57_05260 [Candidatus Limnocylindrales bacterium]|nr:hypothetical protein [Candidatus Limnocylindrales bacterium]
MMKTASISSRVALAATAAIAVAGCQPPDRDALTVQVSLQNETPSVAKGTIVVDYSRAGAKIVSAEGGPACAVILPGVDGTFTDDGRGTLTARIQSKRGLRGPADVIACRMLAAKDDATVSDIRQRLDVKLTEAEDNAGKVLDLTVPVAKARRAAPAVPDAASADAAATEAAAAGEMLAEADTKKVKAEPAPKPAPKPAAPPAPSPPKPAAPPPVAPAVRPPAPPMSGPANAPGAPGRSVINNPALSAAQRDRAFPDYSNGGNDADNDGPSGVGGGNDNDDPFDDSPSDDEAAPAYEVTANVSAGETLGALQFEIIYQGDSGGWAGRGANVICEALTDGLAATNYPGKREVKVGLVSLQGIKSGPVVKCIFRSHERVTANSFTVNVADASNLETAPLANMPRMWVSNAVAVRG